MTFRQAVDIGSYGAERKVTDMESELLTVEEAAEVAKVNPRTIRRLIKSGRLRATSFGLGVKRKKYRVLRSELLSIAESAEKGEFVRPRQRRTTASPAAEFLPRVC